MSLNPEILRWARETAGLNVETAARKIKLNAARGSTGAERLEAIEAGAVSPSASLLQRMATHYRRPLITFYLPKVPASSKFGEDFRTLPDEGDKANPLLAALLRDVKTRQALVREILEEDDDSTIVNMVGAGTKIDDARSLAKMLVEAIGFDRSIYRSSQRIEEAFNYLRNLVESKGVYVLLAGDCGHWTTVIEVSAFRGFVIADELAPMVVINDQDAKSAWPFTLLHELAHLLLGQTGISGGIPELAVEKLCNDVASTILIDSAEIEELSGLLTGRPGDTEAINSLADKAHVSRSMIAYQLFRTRSISFGRWEDLRDSYRREWLTQKERNKEKNRGKDGGPNWYVVRRNRLGAAILSAARRGLAEGTLTPTRAAKMLGVKPMNVYPLLAEQRRVPA